MNINLDGYEIETNWHLEDANDVYSLKKMFEVVKISKNGILGAVSNDCTLRYSEIYKEYACSNDDSDLKELVGEAISAMYKYVIINKIDVLEEELCIITCLTGGFMMESNVRFACYQQNGFYKLLSYLEDLDFGEFEDRFRIVAKTSSATENMDILTITNLLLAAFEINCWVLNGLEEELPVVVAESGELINRGSMDSELYAIIKRKFKIKL